MKVFFSIQGCTQVFYIAQTSQDVWAIYSPPC